MLVTGVDIVELHRIAGVVERYGDRFLRRIYTQGELDFCRGRIPQLAGRFAAKEAVMKALGTGIRGVSWREVEVVRKGGQAPQVQLQGRAQLKAEALGIQELSLTTSHSKDYAVAFVVGVRDEASNH